MNFLQRTPFFRLLVPLICGILFYYFTNLQTKYYILPLVIFGVLFLILFFYKKFFTDYSLRWIFGSVVFGLFLSLGSSLSALRKQQLTFEGINTTNYYLIELTESPIEKERTYICRSKNLLIFDSLHQSTIAKGKSILYFAKDSAVKTLESGDRLLVRTIFNKPDGVVNPNGFDYATYINRQGIVATTYISSDNWEKIGTNSSFSLFRNAEKVQHKILDIYRKFGIKGDEFAVLAALTIGSKDALHPELRQNYTTSGGMHILAVSGLHVGIIYMILSFLFRFLDKNPKLRYLKATLIVLLLWIYAFITGLPPSVIRSTLMFSLIAVGASFERKAQIYNTISLAAFFMLLYNPDFLFDVGFQLSFCAVISIVYYQPIIKKWFVFKSKPMRWVWELTAVSLAAQIGTAGFSIYYFHQFPNYFLITNLVAIPFASFILYTAVALLLVSFVPILSTIIAYILNILLYILNFSIQTIHDLPYSITVAYIDLIQLILVIFAIILFTVYAYNKNIFPLISSLLCILVMLLISSFQIIRNLNTSKFLVFSDNNTTQIGLVDGLSIYSYSTEPNGFKKVASNYIIANKIQTITDIQQKPYFNDGFISFMNHRFLFLTDNLLKAKTTNNPISVDFLVIGNKLKPRISEISECIEASTIIVDKSISTWYTNDIKNYCKLKKINFYSVRDNGAFVYQLK